MRLLLVNPNTNAATTAMMAAIAQSEAHDASIHALTAPHGASLITNEAALAVAAGAVLELLSSIDRQPYQGIVLAAFGDPGLHAVRSLGGPPVTGLAEASMAEAPGRFAVVTTTPDLVRSIGEAAAAYGHAGRFAGVYTTPGDPGSLMASPDSLLEAMLTACKRALDESRADSIVIGGGPLARVAAQLRPMLPVPVIEPIPAAIRLAV